MPRLLVRFGGINVEGGLRIEGHGVDQQGLDHGHEPCSAGFARERGPQGLEAVCRKQRWRAYVRVRSQHGGEPWRSGQRGRSERHVSAENDTDRVVVSRSAEVPDELEAGGDTGDRSTTGGGLATPLDLSLIHI